jgi:hypothetical protein
MAAGLGFKDFTTGEVLTAADVDGYLMQGIWVFASAAARDSAVTSPQEGNACYLKDTNQVLTYSGSAWVAVGGGSPLTTKGDVYGFSTVDARIPVGANNTVLTADSTQALGLKWATPAAGGMTLISETTASAVSSLSFSSIPATYKELYLVWDGIVHSATGSGFEIRLNNDSTTNIYSRNAFGVRNTNSPDTQNNLGESIGSSSLSAFGIDCNDTSTQRNCNGWLRIDNYASTSKYKTVSYNTIYYKDITGMAGYLGSSTWESTAAVTSIDVVRVGGSATFSNASNTSIRLYGLS